MKARINEQLETTKDQGKKQLDAINKNNQMKVKNKDDKLKDMVYLSERPNRIIKLYPSSFDDKSLNVLEKYAINDKKN